MKAATPVTYGDNVKLFFDGRIPAKFLMTAMRSVSAIQRRYWYGDASRQTIFRAVCSSQNRGGMKRKRAKPRPRASIIGKMLVLKRWYWRQAGMADA